MTGEKLLQHLQNLTADERKLECAYVHTAYSDSEDSVGYEESLDVDSVRVEIRKGVQQIRLGY